MTKHGKWEQNSLIHLVLLRVLYKMAENYKQNDLLRVVLYTYETIYHGFQVSHQYFTAI